MQRGQSQALAGAASEGGEAISKTEMQEVPSEYQITLFYCGSDGAEVQVVQ